MSAVVWLQRGPDPDDPDSGLRARVRIPADSAYFEGHFPRQPVFPAVAQLALVGELAQGFIEGAGRMVAGVSQARFRAAVGPEDELELHVALGEGELRFRITGPNGPVSQGRLALAEAVD